MDLSNISTGFIIEGTKQNKAGKYPIKFTVYSPFGKRKYGIKEYVTKDDWERLNKPNLRDVELKKLKFKLNAIESRAKEVIERIQPFSFLIFEEEFFSKKSKSKKMSSDLRELFDGYINDLKDNGQIGTAISYTTTINSIEGFKKNLKVQDITPKFLQSYEEFLTRDGKSRTTVGIYMRQLRALINHAIKHRLLSADSYPFSSYKIPSGRNIKKALPQEDLHKLINYKTEDTRVRKALDFWLFSYLCNGMNFADIAHLNKDSIDDDYMSFIRQKTKRTKTKDVRPIRIGLTTMTKMIIERYKSTDENTKYLFPILKDGISPLEEKYKIQHFVTWTNKYLEGVRHTLGIKQPLKTYAARHSFSTTLKRKGVPTSYIMEALGHSSMATTESYLDSFSDDVKLSYANLLTDI